jgi:hypothetical protein
LFSRAAKIFRIANKSSNVFCSAAQRKSLEFTNKSNSNSLCSVLPRSQKFWNLSTKTTQIDCILFCRAAKNSGIANKHGILFSRLANKSAAFSEIYFVGPTKPILSLANFEPGQF